MVLHRPSPTAPHTHLVVHAILVAVHLSTPQPNSSTGSFLDVVVADNSPVPAAGDTCCSTHARYVVHCIGRIKIASNLTLECCINLTSKQ